MEHFDVHCMLAPKHSILSDEKHSSKHLDAVSTRADAINLHLTAVPTACIASTAAYSSAALLGVEGFSPRAADLIFLNSVRSTSRYAKNSSDWPPKCIAARSASKIACCWTFAVHSAGDAGLAACCQTHHRVRQQSGLVCL